MSLHDLDWDELEELIADLWEEFGYNTEVTAGGSDGGIDVIARRDELYEERILIQVKHYTADNRVAVSDVREYSSLLHQPDVDIVVIVTSGRFTSQAKQEANEIGVKLIDRSRLAQLLETYLPESVHHNSARRGINQDGEELNISNRDSPVQYPENIDPPDSVIESFKEHLIKDTEFIDFYSGNNKKIPYQYAVGWHNILDIDSEKREKSRGICKDYPLTIDNSTSNYLLIKRRGNPDHETLDPEGEAALAMLFIRNVCGYDGVVKPEII